MPLKRQRLLQVLAGLAFLFCGLGIVNTMVSLKYEVQDNGECISVVNGRDLCQALHLNWMGLVGSVILVVVLAFVRTKPVKPKN